MPLDFNDALAEADIEAACRRLGIGPVAASFLVNGYRQDPRLLAASVLTFAMLDPGADPAIRDRRSADCGAEHYIEFVKARGFADYPVPDDFHDWRGSLFRGCCPSAGRPALSAEDRAYALGRFAIEGWRAVAAWVELAFHRRADEADVPVGVAVRIGCRRYLESRLWLRDHRPETLPLSIYVAAG